MQNKPQKVFTAIADLSTESAIKKLYTMIACWLWLLFPTVLSMHFMVDYKVPIIDNDKHVYCDGRVLERVTPNAPVERLFVHGCNPLPYASLMENETTTTEPLELLELLDMPLQPPLSKKHFAEVTAKEIKISGIQPLIPSPDFLDALNVTAKLTVSNMILPPLPESSPFDTVEFTNGRSAGPLGGCVKLLNLRLINWTVEKVPGGYFNNCSMLTVLWLERVSVETMQHVVESADRVHMLTVRNSGLVTLPENLLKKASNLCYIDFSYNNLLYLHENTFEGQRFLMHLDLSKNQLRSETVARALIKLPGVVDLYLGNNSLSDFCDHFDDFARKIHPRLLDLTAAGLTRLCFSSWKFMSNLLLVKNNITELTLTELPMPNRFPSYDLDVDLSENPLHPPPDSLDLYKGLLKKFHETEHTTVRVKMELVVDCDCQHGYLAKVLNMLPNVELPDLVCRENRTLLSVPPQELECDKFTCEPCMCRRRWWDNGTVADCQNLNLHRVPRIPGALALLAADNMIEDINADDFPPSLQLVDLRGNKLERANESAAHALLAKGTNRRVRLSGNPIACDCQNRPLIEALSNYTMKVEDYADIQCANSEYALTQVNVFKLCGALQRVWTLAVVIAGGALIAALVALAGALYCRYGRALRVFLHARGLLCCAREDDLDGDWVYDAFVSFSHKDMSFVEEELLPKLENKPLNWRVCVHYRDWMPGELISTQIARSVAESRCTIVVLSRNLLASVWGMLEFRTAHASALHDGRARLVLIALDDVLEDDKLDSEVRSYVRINTYIQWGDPWFWDKLSYALPHARSGKLCNNIETVEKPIRY